MKPNDASISPAVATQKPQLVELSRTVAGKQGTRIPRRLKAKHLSNFTREIIVRLFVALESYDDVAQEMKINGLTGKTVAEVIHAWQMRKPPTTARTAFHSERGFETVREAQRVRGVA